MEADYRSMNQASRVALLSLREAVTSVGQPGLFIFQRPNERDSRARKDPPIDVHAQALGGQRERVLSIRVCRMDGTRSNALMLAIPQSP
jgi:hypothetical protein